MYALKSFRSRKLIEDCGPTRRGDVRRLYESGQRDRLLNLARQQRTNVPVSENDESENEVSAVPARTRSPSIEVASALSMMECGDCNEVGNCVDSPNVSESENCSGSDSSMHSFRSAPCRLDETLEDFEARLASTFTEVNMNHQQIRAVLRTMTTHSCFSMMHVDPRTILKTPIPILVLSVISQEANIFILASKPVCSIFFKRLLHT